jgi:hypothetical protein
MGLIGGAVVVGAVAVAAALRRVSDSIDVVHYASTSKCSHNRSHVHTTETTQNSSRTRTQGIAGKTHETLWPLGGTQ